MVYEKTMGGGFTNTGGKREVKLTYFEEARGKPVVINPLQIS